MRRNNRFYVFNRQRRGKIRSAEKVFRHAVTTGDKAIAAVKFTALQSVLSRGKKWGTIHQNRVAKKTGAASALLRSLN